MAWTTPATWTASQLVDENDMNTQIRDNLNALKDPPTDIYNVNEASDYTTTSTTFVDVDATDLALTITTTGGHDVMVGFVGSVTRNAANAECYFDLDLDGARQGGDDGICATVSAAVGDVVAVSFVFLIQNVTAASHTIKLQWKTQSGTATLYAGAGTAGLDLHPQLWFREVT